MHWSVPVSDAEAPGLSWSCRSYVYVDHFVRCDFEATSKGARSCHTILLQATERVTGPREARNVFEEIWRIATQSRELGVVRTEAKPGKCVSNFGS